jgi:hypothetical protein
VRREARGERREERGERREDQRLESKERDHFFELVDNLQTHPEVEDVGTAVEDLVLMLGCVEVHERCAN